jgi:hypothetical protein
MYRVVGGVLLLLLVLPARGAEDKPKDTPGTPAEQYQALLKEYQDNVKGKQPGEMMKLAQEAAPKFLALAEKNPKDPAALDALSWVVTNFRGQQRISERTKALEMLTRDHTQSDQVSRICQSLTRNFDKESGDFLRAVLEKNPSRDVQGQACLALAMYLKNRGRVLEALKSQPQVEQALVNMVGKEYTEELKKLDQAKADKEVEAMLERAADKYADVTVPGGGTVGEKVKLDLFEIRHLGIGKPAPEIEGEDLEGKKFKLSDYRGKVVMLDFWGHW